MRRLLLPLLLAGLLAACAPARPTPQAVADAPASPTSAPSSTPAATVTSVPVTPSPPPSATAVPPKPNPRPSPTAPYGQVSNLPLPAGPSPTATPTPSATPIPLCKERFPAAGDLLALVNHDYGLAADYKPDDLVPLGDTFPSAVTRGYPTQVRAIIIPPLQELIAAMHEEGLRPFVVSGYRGYWEQNMARQKWAEQFPEWAHNISARPGHSEHQLGTTVDFSTPDLPPDLEFHPAFADTGEGEWLAAHAHEYGFTMSYPDDHYEETGFNYEPWHFRYVGVELAATLHTSGLTISEYLLATYGPPCLP